jgi:hypothetical protein
MLIIYRCKIPLVRIGVRTLLLFLPFVIFMCLVRLMITFVVVSFFAIESKIKG